MNSPMGVSEGLAGINETGILMIGAGLSTGSVVDTSVVTIVEMLLLQSKVFSIVCGSETMSSSREGGSWDNKGRGVNGFIGEDRVVMVGTRGVSVSFIILTVFSERAFVSAVCKSCKIICKQLAKMELVAYLYDLVVVKITWGNIGRYVRWLGLLKALQREFRVTKSIVL